MFFFKLSVTDGDVALEMVNDHPSPSGATGLVCCISVRSPRAGYVPASGRAGQAIPMARSTRHERAVLSAVMSHEYAESCDDFAWGGGLTTGGQETRSATSRSGLSDYCPVPSETAPSTI